MHLLLHFLILSKFILSSDEAELVFAGDAMQHQAQLNAALTPAGVYDYSECFTDIAHLLRADYAVVNLETPIGSKNFTGYPCFNSPSEFAKSLRDVGFDLMLTANNHTLDRRDRGLRETLDSLEAAEISHIGTYRNPADRDTHLPFVKDIAGFKVGFLNYTYGTNGITLQGDAVVDYIDRQLMAEDIKATRAAGAEIITVAIHWGNEYQLYENSVQRSLADFLIDCGADLIIGSHPHVVQPIEIRHNESTGKDALIVYSLGNFISNMESRDTRGGAIVRVKLKRDDNGIAQFAGVDYHLVFTVQPPKYSGLQYRLVNARLYNEPHLKNECDDFVQMADKVLGSRLKRSDSLVASPQNFCKAMQEAVQSESH